MNDLMEPPWDVEAEESCIAAVLVDADAMAKLSGIVEPRMFFRQPHQEVWAAALDLWQRGQPLNLVTVGSELKAQGKLAVEYATNSWVAEIIRRLPTSFGAEFYAGLVRSHWQRRRIIEAGQIIQALGHKDGLDVDGILDQASMVLNRVTGERRRPVSLPLADVLRGVDGRMGVEEIVLSTGREEDLGRGQATEWEQFDDAVGGLQRGRVYTFLGRTSAGKSFVALNLALTVAAAGSGVLYASTEMPYEEVGERLVWIEAGINSRDVVAAGGLSPSHEARVTEAIGRLAELPMVISTAGKLSLQSLQNEVRRQVAQRQIGGIVVDVLQDITTGGETQEVRLREAITGIKALAMNQDIWAIVVSHVGRTSIREGRLDAHSGLGAGAIEQASDVLITLEPVARGVDRKPLDGWGLITDGEVSRIQAERGLVPIQAVAHKVRGGAKAVLTPQILMHRQGGRWLPLVADNSGGYLP